MRDILLFTVEPMTKKECLPLLSNAIANIQENGDDIMIDGKNRAYLSFSCDRLNESDDVCSKELQQNVPIENAYIARLETYRSIDAKRIITELVKVHPELFVNLDDETDWYGSAEQFLNKEFDF